MLIKQTDQEIIKRILKVFCSQINDRMSLRLDVIKKEITDLFPLVLKYTPTYNALVYGRLGDELGLPAGEAQKRVDSIIELICKSIEIEFKPFRPYGSSIRGGLFIRIIKKDFKDIVKDKNAIVTTQKGVDLNWLEWLLERGNSFIVIGYSYKNLPGKNKGRSGDGLMIKRKNGNNNWRIPPEFSGTVDNNWVTRSIDDSKKLITLEILKIIEKNL